MIPILVILVAGAAWRLPNLFKFFAASIIGFCLGAGAWGIIGIFTPTFVSFSGFGWFLVGGIVGALFISAVYDN